MTEGRAGVIARLKALIDEGYKDGATDEWHYDARVCLDELDALVRDAAPAEPARAVDPQQAVSLATLIAKLEWKLARRRQLNTPEERKNRHVITPPVQSIAVTFTDAGALITALRSAREVMRDHNGRDDESIDRVPAIRRTDCARRQADREPDVADAISRATRDSRGEVPHVVERRRG